MAAPVNDILVWAEQDVDLPNTGRENKVKPSPDISDKGYDKGQKPAAEEFNWVLNNLGQWVRYLAKERIPDLEENTDKKLDDLKEEIEEKVRPFLVPVGGVILWTGAVPPSGYLELNGQAFDTALNPLLAIQFPSGFLPDWRGRFVRSWAHGSVLDPDSDRPIGSFQEDALQEIQGEFVVDDWGWVDGKLFQKKGGRSSGWQSQGGGDAVEFKAGNVARTSSETRPINVAAMYIIKTDLADADPETPAPTGIILTPSAIEQVVGYSVPVVGQVIPSSLAPNFPITYSSSNTNVFTVHPTSGLVTLVGGGSATLIAEISTGLTSTIVVNSFIATTSLSLAVPEIHVGGAGQVIVTRTPPTSDEPLVYSSSNTDVVVISQSGAISGVSPGTSIITVTGYISGTSATASITVTEAVPELYGIGSMVVAHRASSFVGTMLIGSTVAGSELYVRPYSRFHNDLGSGSIIGEGIWRMMGGMVIAGDKEGNGINNCFGGALFLRIS